MNTQFAIYWGLFWYLIQIGVVVTFLVLGFKILRVLKEIVAELKRRSE